MTGEHALTRVEPGSQSPAALGGALVVLDPRVVAVARQNLQVLEDLVTNVMEEEIDYGRLPGTQGPGLWDAGASTLMDAYNVYSDPHILSQTQEGGVITLYMMVELRHRDTKQVVATGVGAASGLEPKYAYRWLTAQEALTEAGVTKEMLANLPTRKRRDRDQGEVTLYRVGNPDPGELVNTLFKMGAKRAEVDAAQALPQVKKALAKLFSREGDEQKVNWRNFFGEIRRLGYTEDQAHDLLKVKSFKDWTSSGRTLEQAIAVLREARQRGQAGPPAAPVPAPGSSTQEPRRTQPISEPGPGPARPWAGAAPAPATGQAGLPKTQEEWDRAPISDPMMRELVAAGRRIGIDQAAVDAELARLYPGRTITRREAVALREEWLKRPAGEGPG